MKRRIVAGLIVAVVVFAVLITFVGRGDVARQLALTDPRVVALGALFGASALLFRSLVWVKFIGSVDTTMTWHRIIPLYLVAMFVKYSTPYGQVATEPFVAYLVSRDGEMDYEGGLAGILSADLLNYVPYYTFGLTAAVLIALGGALGPDLRGHVFAFIGLFLVIAMATYVVAFREHVMRRLVFGGLAVLDATIGRLSSRISRRLQGEQVDHRIGTFYGAVGDIRKDRSSLLWGTTFAHLGMIGLMAPMYIATVGFGYEIEISVVVLVVALGKLGSIIPAPGGLGGVETTATLAITVLTSIDAAAALAIVLIWRACTYWLTLGVGGIATIGFTFRA